MQAGEHLHWGADDLWRTLDPLLPNLSVEVMARTDSTNSQLIERARLAGRPREAAGAAAAADDAHGRRAGDSQPCLLVAETQTRGRGRQGRHWEAAAGASLTFSLALPLAPTDWAGLSLAVGVALAEALDDRQPPVIGLKWPNDLWLTDGPGRGRKLGGVLIETVNVGAHRMAVVGVGLNVLPLAATPGHDFASGFACLSELDPQASAPAALHRLAPALVQALRLFERHGFAPFSARFDRRDLLRGCAVTTSASEVPEGVADGVEADGRLRLRVGVALHHVAGGDVSVRPVAG